MLYVSNDSLLIFSWIQKSLTFYFHKIFSYIVSTIVYIPEIAVYEQGMINHVRK